MGDTQDKDGPPPRRFGCQRSGCGCLFALLLLYVGAYAFMSWRGSHVMRASGAVHAAGISIPDQQVWMPLGVVFHASQTADGISVVEANWLGWLFAPAIAIDRWLVHPSASLEGHEKDGMERVRKTVDEVERWLKEQVPKRASP